MLKRGIAAFAALMLISTSVSWAAGLWAGEPLLGGSSYCTANNASTPSVGGITGQAGVTTVCAQTTPAGPSTFTGQEGVPADLYGPNQANPTVTSPVNIPQSTVYLNIGQLGQGAFIDQTTPTTATISNNTAFYFIDGAVATSFTLTLPSSPVEGQIVRVVCETATTGGIIFAANASTNQTIKGTPPAGTQCVQGVGYAFRFVTSATATSNVWFRM